MKKTMLALGTLALTGILLGTAACSDSTHEHTWGNWTTVKAATILKTVRKSAYVQMTLPTRKAAQ